MISKLNHPPIPLGATLPLTRTITSFMLALICKDKSDIVTRPKFTRFNISSIFWSMFKFKDLLGVSCKPFKLGVAPMFSGGEMAYNGLTVIAFG